VGELDNSTAVLDEQSGKAMFNAEQQSQSLLPLTVDADHSFISTISKISPSPDWFSGFTDYSILDRDAGTWLSSVEIDTYPWDAGTDSGAVYRSSDTPTDPPRVITRIQVDTETAEARGLPREGIFVNTDGSVLPVAKWICTISGVATPTDAADSSTAAPTVSESVATTASPVSSPPSVSPTASPSGTPTKAPNVAPTATPTTGQTNTPTAAPTEKVDPFQVVSATPGGVSSSDAIGVTCMIMNEWTVSRHPKDYPTGNATWSPMVVASHSEAFQMWERGQLASSGVRSVAEVRFTCPFMFWVL